MGRRWQEVRVYQDGLPDTRADIVARIVADVDSPNYRLLRWLAGQEAMVVGTEDPVLLQEEYELLKASVTDEAARQAYAARAAGLLESRDRYIATRIGDTLPSAWHGRAVHRPAARGGADPAARHPRHQLALLP